MFRCEDDRFEADVIIGTTRSALSQLELLEKELEDMNEEEAALRLKTNALSAIQLAAIRRVYAYHGADTEVMNVCNWQKENEMVE